MGLQKEITDERRGDKVKAYINVFGFHGDGTPVLKAKLTRESRDNHLLARWPIVMDNDIIKKEFRNELLKLVYKYAKMVNHNVNKEEISFSDKDNVLEEINIGDDKDGYK